MSKPLAAQSFSEDALRWIAPVSVSVLRRMSHAADRLEECERVLGNGGDNVVSELLRGGPAFYEWDHYPQGDVFDPVSHSQYYYHAHPQEERPHEHGHFHLFLRPRGMPAQVRPAPVPDYAPCAVPDDALSHLVAIAMSRAGEPVKLFTTNRWVTAETWYAAPDVIAMLDRFRIDHARPSWPLNIWISNMPILFRPQIEHLLLERDAVARAEGAVSPARDFYEDRDFEVLSQLDIALDRQIAAIRSEMRRRGLE